MPHLQGGERVRVVQTIRTRTGDWRTEVTGRVVSACPQPTGSWFAHGKDDLLWLMRLRLEKDDGEIVDLVVNGATDVTVIPGTAGAPPG
jgi:hypothetical protein